MAKNFDELFPNFAESFNETGAKLFEESDLDPKTIELLILSFGIARQCDACIEHHVGKLVELGATENEIATVVAVAHLMSGGPGSAYGSKALSWYYKKSK